MTQHYGRYTFIPMGIEPDDRFEQQARADAASRGWQFEIVPGDMRLIQELVDGPWNERDFLLVRPGQRIVPSYDERVIKTEHATGTSP